MLTLMQIKYFLSVCENHSVSKAANALFISQPAVSSALKDMEQECNAALFIRQSNGLALTEEGKIFKAQAQEFMTHYDNMLNTIKKPAAANDTLALGVSPMNGCVVMPKIFHDFNQRYPNTKLNIHEDGSTDLIRLLLNCNIDVAIVSKVTNHSKELNQFVIKRQKVLLCMHEKYPLARNKQLTIPMLADVPIITYYKSYAQNDLLVESFSKYGLKPNVIYRTGQLAMVERAIKNSIAVGLLFEDIALELPGVVSFEIEEFPTGSITMVWKKDHYLSSGARKFIEFIKEWAPYL